MALKSHGFGSWEEALASSDATQIKAINESALLTYGASIWEEASKNTLENLSREITSLVYEESTVEESNAIEAVSRLISSFPYEEYTYE